MPRPFLDRRNISRTANTPPKISLKLFGNWTGAMNTLKELGPKVKIASVTAQLKVGKIICQKVRGHLLRQDLDWPALNDVYLTKKQNADLSGNILMAYKTYFNSIKVWKTANNHLVSIGVKKGIYTTEINGKKSKMDVATIAAVHEFSSGKRIPKRPLWNPSIAEIGGAKGIKKMYVNSLVWHLRAVGVQVKTKRGIFSSLIVDDKKISF